MKKSVGTEKLGLIRFNSNTPGVGGMTFAEAWEKDKTLVFNTMIWDSATGIWGKWKEYCSLRKDDFPPDFRPPILQRWLKKQTAKRNKE